MRRTLTLFVIHLVLLFSAAFVFNADVSAAKPKKSAKTALPDIVVSKAQLDSKCMLHITLQNQGKGVLSDTEYRAVKLKINLGNQQKEIYPGKYDHKGSLRRAGGRVKIDTAILVSSSAILKIHVDSTGIVKESNENNNELKTKVSPTCAVKQTPEKPKPSSGAKKTKSRQDKTPQSDDLKKAAPVSVPASKLLIEKIRNHNNQIQVILQRDGTEPLDSSQAARSQLRIEVGGKRMIWPLFQVDPGFKKLNHKRGVVPFDTGVKLSESIKVRALITGVDSGQPITTMLSPSTRQSNQNLGRQKSREKTQAQMILPGKTFDNPAPEMVPRSTESPALKSDPAVSEGMAFKRPRQGAVYLTGKDVDVSLHFVNRSAVRPYKLFLLKDGERLLEFPPQLLPEPDESMKFTIQLPINLASSDTYQLKAITAGGGPYALSQHFLVKKTNNQGRNDGIRITIDGNPQQLRPGDQISATISITSPDAPPFDAYWLSSGMADLTLYLADHHMAYAGEWPNWWLQEAQTTAAFGDDNRSFTIQATIPQDVPVGDSYRLCFFHTEGSGESPVFAVYPEGADHAQINVLTNAEENDRWVRFSTQDIIWNHYAPPGTPVPEQWRIEFLAQTPSGGEFPVFSLNSSATSDGTVDQNGLIYHQFRHSYQVGQLEGPHHIRISGGGVEGRTAQPINFILPSELNAAVSDIRVSENGQLQVYVSLRPPAGARNPASYPGSFVVSKNILSGPVTTTTVTRNIPLHGTLTTQGWISLGHVNSFTTENDRRIKKTARFSVSLQLPADIQEDDVSDNTIEGGLRIRAYSLTIGMGTNSSNSSSSGTLYFTGAGSGLDPRYSFDTQVHISNHGYAPARGLMRVRQIASHRPGELDGGADRTLDLGSRQLVVQPSETISDYAPSLAEFISGRGIAQPEWYIGRLIFHFTGDLAVNISGGAEMTFDFDYREHH